MRAAVSIIRVACTLGAVCWTTACSEATPPAGVPHLATDPADDHPGAAVYSSCASCHMLDGGGRADGSIPRLAGQRADVVVARLHALQDGRVQLPVMTAFARSLDAGEVVNVAAWLAGLPPPAIIGWGSGDELAHGASIFADQCASCHGAAGQGADRTPRLCGQHAAYLLRRMEEVEQGNRGNPSPVMAAVLAPISGSERAAVADFLSRVPCGIPAAP